MSEKQAAPNSLSEMARIEIEALGIATKGYTLFIHVSILQSRLVWSTYPEEWIKRYQSKHYYFFDPVVAWTLTAIGTSRWSEITKYKNTLTNHVMLRAAEYGLAYGATSSQITSKGARISLSVARHDRELTPGEIVKLENVLSRVKARFEERMELTDSQVETIRMLSEGISQEEIAKLEGVSRDAVKKRVERIRIRLNVKNTTEIVAYSIRNSIIK